MKRLISVVSLAGLFCGPALAADLAAVAQVAQEMVTVTRGDTVNLDLRSADVRTVLQKLADVGRVNVVVSEAVTGSVTLQMKNVHWKTAMAMVLRAKGLDSDREGNVIYVDRQDVIQEARMERLQCSAGMKLAADEFCFKK